MRCADCRHVIIGAGPSHRDGYCPMCQKHCPPRDGGAAVLVGATPAAPSGAAEAKRK